MQLKTSNHYTININVRNRIIAKKFKYFFINSANVLLKQKKSSLIVHTSFVSKSYRCYIVIVSYFILLNMNFKVLL